MFCQTEVGRVWECYTQRTMLCCGIRHRNARDKIRPQLLIQAAFRHEPGEVRIGFGAAEVIDRHPHGFPVVRERRRHPAHRDESCRGHPNGPCSHGVVPRYASKSETVTASLLPSAAHQRPAEAGETRCSAVRCMGLLGVI